MIASFSTPAISWFYDGSPFYRLSTATNSVTNEPVSWLRWLPSSHRIVGSFPAHLLQPRSELIVSQVAIVIYEIASRIIANLDQRKCNMTTRAMALAAPAIGPTSLAFSQAARSINSVPQFEAHKMSDCIL